MMEKDKHSHDNLDAIEKLFSNVTHQFLGAPNTVSTYHQIVHQVQSQIEDIINDSILYGTNVESSFIDFDIQFMDKKEVDPLSLSEIVEERLESFIYETMDRQYILDCGSCIDSVIVEKAYEEIDKLLHEEEVSEEEFDTLASEVMKNIDFDLFNEIIDNILDAPITMEEKLAEVGMSQRDFL